VEITLRTQQYNQQPNAIRGLLLKYIAKMTGLSPAQVDRLVGDFGRRARSSQPNIVEIGFLNDARAPMWNCWRR
jgi:hypothetical protein